MKIGDTLYLEPTLACGYMKESCGPKPCRVISTNEKHRHFTVEFDFPAGKFREGYKMEGER